MYEEDEFLLLSGIQHFCFCRRQWALIHVEQLWDDNLLTTEGNILHEKTHDAYKFEKRADLLISRGMAVRSFKMGVSGICDVVELRRDEENGVPIRRYNGLWLPCPVEYKHGKSKSTDADRLQLCAQAMCLEEMLSCAVPNGYLFYAQTRRREEVEFTDELRKTVCDMFEEMHIYFNRQYTPKVKVSKSCKSCSLAEFCIPELNKNPSAHEYIAAHIQDGGDM